MYSDSALSVSPRGIHNTEKQNIWNINLSTFTKGFMCCVCTLLCSSNYKKKVISTIECKGEAWFSTGYQSKDRRKRDTCLLVIGFREWLTKFWFFTTLKKSASDSAYLSDSLQGQLLHEVNFISFFQMFVLPNWTTKSIDTCTIVNLQACRHWNLQCIRIISFSKAPSPFWQTQIWSR